MYKIQDLKVSIPWFLLRFLPYNEDVYEKISAIEIRYALHKKIDRNLMDFIIYNSILSPGFNTFILCFRPIFSAYSNSLFGGSSKGSREMENVPQ